MIESQGVEYNGHPQASFRAEFLYRNPRDCGQEAQAKNQKVFEQPQELEVRTMDDDKKQEMIIPRTVGEMIEFLQKFPKDRILDIYYVEHDYYGSDYETEAYRMEFEELKDYGSLELTVK